MDSVGAEAEVLKSEKEEHAKAMDEMARADAERARDVEARAVALPTRRQRAVHIQQQRHGARARARVVREQEGAHVRLARQQRERRPQG